jgi:hypothetical protein
MREDAMVEHRFFYWLRLSISHYGEAASYLARTEHIAEVTQFVTSLETTVQKHYRHCIDAYRRLESTIERVRNEASFHYPTLNVSRKRRPVQKALKALANERGIVDMGPHGVIRGSRMLFADDVAALLVVRASEGWTNLHDAHPEIANGITSFMRFTNPAIDEFFYRAAQRGGDFVMEEPQT